VTSELGFLKDLCDYCDLRDPFSSSPRAALAALNPAKGLATNIACDLFRNATAKDELFGSRRACRLSRRTSWQVSSRRSRDRDGHGCVDHRENSAGSPFCATAKTVGAIASALRMVSSRRSQLPSRLSSRNLSEP
jgi:hypothetical protein